MFFSKRVRPAGLQYGKRMTSSTSGSDKIVEKLADPDYVMRDDIQYSSHDIVTT
jgi:hypothetical protein